MHTNPLTSLVGRVALVTGSARGIGRAVAEQFAKNGAIVWLTDIDREELARTEAEFLARGYSVRSAACDVTSMTEVDALMEAVSEVDGSLSLLVVNAGRMTHGSVETADLEEWEQGLRVNLTGGFITLQRGIPRMATDGTGRIIVVSSAAGSEGSTKAGVSYAVAKAGLDHLTSILSNELGSRRITVNAVAPGPVKTRMSRSFDESLLHQMLERSPGARFASAEDIALTVLFLACEMGRCVNGHVLRVSGPV